PEEMDGNRFLAFASYKVCDSNLSVTYPFGAGDSRYAYFFCSEINNFVNKVHSVSPRLSPKSDIVAPHQGLNFDFTFPTHGHPVTFPSYVKRYLLPLCLPFDSRIAFSCHSFSANLLANSDFAARYSARHISAAISQRPRNQPADDCDASGRPAERRRPL